MAASYNNIELAQFGPVTLESGPNPGNTNTNNNTNGLEENEAKERKRVELLAKLGRITTRLQEADLASKNPGLMKCLRELMGSQKKKGSGTP